MQAIYVADLLGIAVVSMGIVQILIVIGDVKQLGLQGGERELGVSTN